METLVRHLHFAEPEEPSKMPCVGSLEILPRSLRGCYTVNLHQGVSIRKQKMEASTYHHRIHLRHQNQQVVQN